MIGKTVPRAGRYRSWFIPQQGYSLVRLEIGGGEGKKLGLVIDNQPALDKPSGVWFPKKSHWQTFDPDGRISNDSITEVQVAEFNRVIDPGVFTLASIRPTPGTPVKDYDDLKMQFWTGEKIADKYSGPIPPELAPFAVPLNELPENFPQPVPMTATNDPTRTSRWFYLVATLLAVVGCGLVAYAVRLRL